MKPIILFAPAIALAGLAAGCNKGADELQPGQWEMVMQVKSLEMPGAPPETQAQLRSGVGQSRTNQECITAERARNPVQQMRQMMAQSAAANCRFSDEVFGGGVIRIRATCPGPGGQAAGGGSVSMEGTFTATTLNATFSVNAQAGGPGMAAGGMNMSAEIRGRRIGDCPAGAAGAARPGNGL